MAAEHILYIHYDASLVGIRELFVSKFGCEVTSVLGNNAAKSMAKRGAFRLFIVGHAAPYKERRAMAEWLKANVPAVPVLALCPTPFEAVDYADYQVDAHNPEAWVDLVREVLEGQKLG